MESCSIVPEVLDGVMLHSPPRVPEQLWCDTARAAMRTAKVCQRGLPRCAREGCQGVSIRVAIVRAMSISGGGFSTPGDGFSTGDAAGAKEATPARPR